MSSPIDGRGKSAPEYEPGAMPPAEFQRAFCDTLMATWVSNMPMVGPPPGVSPEQARLFHGTYLKYFSFFAWKFPSWLMNAASRCPYMDVRVAAISDCVDEEVGDDEADGYAHIELLYQEAEAVGISREEIYSAEPTGPILAALHAFENFSRTLSWLGSWAAIGALEIAQSAAAGESRARLTSPEKAALYNSLLGGQAFHERLGLAPESLIFLAHHSYKDQAHGGGELDMIVKYAHTKQLQEEVLWAAKATPQVLGVMHGEIVKLAHAAIGMEPDPRFMTQG